MRSNATVVVSVTSTASAKVGTFTVVSGTGVLVPEMPVTPTSAWQVSCKVMRGEFASPAPVMANVYVKPTYTSTFWSVVLTTSYDDTDVNVIKVLTVNPESMNTVATAVLAG